MYITVNAKKVMIGKKYAITRTDVAKALIVQFKNFQLPRLMLQCYL
jgi:hypothetical protein